MLTIRLGSQTRVIMQALTTVLCAACLFLVTPLQAQESSINGPKPARSSIQGVVTAIGPESPATPLRGVALKLSRGSLGAQPLTTLTDVKGHYEFRQLATGTYFLETSVEGLEFVKTIVLNENETRVENVVLLAMSFKVEVQVQASTVSEQSAESQKKPIYAARVIRNREPQSTAGIVDLRRSK